MKKATTESALPSPLTRLWPSVLTFLFMGDMGLWAFSFQPPVGRTGAPPGNMTCAACHTGNGSGQMEVRFAEESMNYLPGKTYELTVTLTDPGQERFGFSMTARNEDNPTEPIGSWKAGENAVVYDDGRHVGHSDAPFAEDGFTFSVEWTAPSSSEAGPVTFFYAGNAANGDFSNGAGDHVYSGELTVAPMEEESSFWKESSLVDGWRNSGEAYPDIAGIGWIRDAAWPWIYTFAHQGSAQGEWVFIFEGQSSRFGFWGYNASRDYFFWGAASFGWYYSFADGGEGWFEYEL
jgi:hypothetical protein